MFANHEQENIHSLKIEKANLQDVGTYTVIIEDKFSSATLFKEEESSQPQSVPSMENKDADSGKFVNLQRKEEHIDDDEHLPAVLMGNTKPLPIEQEKTEITDANACASENNLFEEEIETSQKENPSLKKQVKNKDIYDAVIVCETEDNEQAAEFVHHIQDLDRKWHSKVTERVKNETLLVKSLIDSDKFYRVIPVSVDGPKCIPYEFASLIPINYYSFKQTKQKEKKTKCILACYKDSLKLEEKNIYHISRSDVSARLGFNHLKAWVSLDPTWRHEMESKLSQMQKWTCFICQKPPLSIESLERQEKSGVIIYIDWDYRSILRCSSCMNCFHADCANKLRMKTIIMKSKTKEGTDYKLQCTDDIAKILLSKDTDPAVKEIIVNGLMPLAQVDMHSNTSPDDMASASSYHTDTPSTSSCNAETPSTSSFNADTPSTSSFNADTPSTCTSSTSNIHLWTDKQEDMLVHLRHERHDAFGKTRNHNTLWKDIANEINSTFKCNITATQVMNKYFNLKKRWKEVLDGARGSGSEAKYFRLKEDFDQQYGTKASSRPAYLLDTIADKDKNKNAKETNETENPASKVTKGQGEDGKGKKRKSTDVVCLLEKQNTDFMNKMEEFHKDKMNRFDKLLDLYKKDLDRK
ncbi:unnamed protein product [Mytilus edulis]|uniref:Myb/SANT-like DNA-binding domain-containing protein n=1 Tax=Mytilus edulis TaxID=6550 RepID=A0A8S3QXI6_MYTED|nr:unnamed protein product [Mytilus edulis]